MYNLQLTTRQHLQQLKQIQLVWFLYVDATTEIMEQHNLKYGAPAT